MFKRVIWFAAGDKPGVPLSAGIPPIPYVLDSLHMVLSALGLRRYLCPPFECCFYDSVIVLMYISD